MVDEIIGGMLHKNENSVIYGGNKLIEFFRDPSGVCMLWINTFAVLCMTPMVLRIVKDFKKQKDLGLDPIFDPKTVGIEDEEGVWDGYAELKRKRGDYENEALGSKLEK